MQNFYKSICDEKDDMLDQTNYFALKIIFKFLISVNKIDKKIIIIEKKEYLA